MAQSSDLIARSSSERDALISTLLVQVEALAARVESLKGENAALLARIITLETENVALREKLQAPPKTPGNSGTPPSQGHKANGDGKASPKARVHAGAHRPLHPNPTRCVEVRSEHCPRCRANVTGVAQVAVQAYDRIEMRACKAVGGWFLLEYVAGSRKGESGAEAGVVGQAGSEAAAARRGDGNQLSTVLPALWRVSCQVQRWAFCPSTAQSWAPNFGHPTLGARTQLWTQLCSRRDSTNRAWHG